MRKIDVIANEKFNGDTFKAIEYLLNTLKEEGSFNCYISELTPQEAGFVLDLEKKISRLQYRMISMDLSVSEVEEAARNPYCVRLIVSFLGFAAGLIFALAVNVFGRGSKNIRMIGIIIPCFLFLLTTSYLLNFFWFRNLKKEITSSETVRQALCKITKDMYPDLRKHMDDNSFLPFD